MTEQTLPNKSKSTLRKVVRVFWRTLSLVAVTVILLAVALQFPAVQSFVAQQVLVRLSKDLDTKVYLKSVAIRLPNQIDITQLLIEDRNQDTLLAAQSMSIGLNIPKLFFNEVEVSSLVLDQVAIQTRRGYQDSVFNYQFILDKFITEQPSDTNTTSIQLSIDKIKLRDIRYSAIDSLTGSYQTAFLGKLKTKIDRIDLEQLDIRLAYLYLDNTRMAFIQDSLNYNSVNPYSASEQVASPTASDTATPLRISLKTLDIANCAFQYLDKSVPHPLSEQLDYSDLNAQAINLKAQNLQLVNDSIGFELQTLSLKEHSGLQIHDLQTNASIHPKGIYLDGLNLNFNDSHIADKIYLRTKKYSDYNKFVKKVKFKANLDNSYITRRDLAYFVPALPKNMQSTHVSGRISGPISSLKGKSLALQYGSKTKFTGDFYVMGLPDVKETFIDFTAENLMSYAGDIQSFLPQNTKLPSEVTKLGNIGFSGQFAGFLSDFVAYGNLTSDLGSLAADINLKIDDDDAKQSAFKGNVSSPYFNLGAITPDDSIIGPVALELAVHGKGLGWKDIDAQMEGAINLLTLKQYEYHDIKLKGQLKNQFFSGNFSVKDTNVDLSFEGTVDYAHEEPVFTANIAVAHIDLLATNLSKDSLAVAADLDVDFESLDPDKLTGHIFASGLTIEMPNFQHDADSIILESVQLGKQKVVQLRSNLLDAVLYGDIVYSQLPQVFDQFLDTFYNQIDLIDSSFELAGHQEFDFRIDVKDLSPVFQFLDLNAKVSDSTSFVGSFNSQAQKLKLKVNAPRIEYDGMVLDSLRGVVETNNDQIHYYLNSPGFKVNESFKLTTAAIIGTIDHNQLQYRLRAIEAEKRESLKLTGTISGSKDSLVLLFDEGMIRLDSNNWYLQDNSQVLLKNNKLITQNFSLNNKEQRIAVSVPNQSLDIIEVSLQQIDMGPISNAVPSPYLSFDGGLNAQLTIKSLFDSPIFEVKGSILRCAFNNELLGKLNFDFTYTDNNGQVDGLINLEDEVNDLNLSIKHLNKPSQNTNIDGVIKNIPINLLEPFAVGIISNMKGNISGDFKASGPTDQLSMKGNIEISNAGLSIDYLNSYFTFDPIHIDLTEQWMNINPTKIYSNGVPADVGGNIDFNDFVDMEFQDFYVYTDNNFQFMNTTASHNDLFYGNMYGKAVVLVNGLINDLDVYINASSAPGTKVYLPISFESSFSEYDFIHFTSESARDSLEEIDIESSGIHLTVDIDATPDAEIWVIFDEQSGDIIKAKGTGKLSMTLDEFYNMTMVGNYTIVEGQYVLARQDLISKKFDIKSGSGIQFSGDPYNAHLAVDAIYNVRDVSPYDLVADLNLTESEQKEYRKPIDVAVQMKLTGTLETPEINFEITPSTTQNALTSSFSRRLTQMQSDNNELNKQVFGLIVFNRFLPTSLSSSGGFGQADIVSGGVTTLTEFLTSQVSLYLNNWISATGFELGLNYSNYSLNELGTQQSGGIQRNNLELALQRRIGDFTINVGGNLDFGNTSTDIASSNNIAGDFKLEYTLPKNPNFRLKAFRTGEYDIFEDANNNKTGFGIYYTRQFNTYDDLIKKKAK